MVLTKTPICNFDEKAHDFNLKGVDNKFYKLDNCLGKNGTLIMFICNHCPYVKAIIQELVKDIKDIISQFFSTKVEIENTSLLLDDSEFADLAESELLILKAKKRRYRAGS